MTSSVEEALHYPELVMCFISLLSALLSLASARIPEIWSVEKHIRHLPSQRKLRAREMKVSESLTRV